MAETPEAEHRRKELGERVRRRRMALGWTQTKLSAQTGIAQGVLSRLEKGEYKTINVLLLAQLADALETTSDFLLSRIDDPGPIPFREECVSVA